jgi:hypothetical protein
MARQLIEAGARIDAILDTTPAANRKRAWRHLIAYVRSPYFFPSLTLSRTVRRKVPVIRHVTGLRAEGEGKLQRIAYRIGESDPAIAIGGPDSPIPIEADCLLLHHGVVPDTTLAMAAGVPHWWDDLHACWMPLVDPLGATQIGGLAIAGDAAGIAGGQSAAWRGVMAAANIVYELKPSVALPAGKLARSALSGFARGRKYLDIRYRPSKPFRRPTGDTIVCPCEGITAGQVLAAKSFLRCGMGECRGRRCLLPATELVAEARGVTPSEAGYPDWGQVTLGPEK